jgi:hypothetical protein
VPPSADHGQNEAAIKFVIMALHGPNEPDLAMIPFVMAGTVRVRDISGYLHEGAAC